MDSSCPLLYGLSMTRCRKHKCQHDQATQVLDMAVCDLCGRECEAMGDQARYTAIELDLDL